MPSYTALSDLELLALLNQENKLAYAEIYNRYKTVLYIHALKIVKDEIEAEDIIHDLFAVLWEKAGSIKINTPLDSYLFRSVRNRVFDLLSHKKVENKYIDSLQGFLDSGECITDHQLREKELNAIIEKEISLLPAKMREVFELSRKSNLSHKEIAQELNISDKTVKKQVNNAIKILRLKINLLFTLFPFL